MINVTTEIQIIDSDGLHAACTEIFERTVAPLTLIQVGSRTSKQHHKRRAIAKFSRLRARRVMSEDDLKRIFKLATLKNHSEAIASKLYFELTSHYPDTIEDLTGLVVPFKALLCLLWAKKILTLPYTFDLSATWKKNPEFEHFTHGFISEIAKGGGNVERASRSWQYRTSWHSPTDVEFTEIWESIPKIVNLGLENGNKVFCFIPWLKKFSAEHSEIISSDQCFYLQRYQMYLLSKRAHNQDISSYVKSYKEYVKYYVMSPEEVESLPTHDRKLRRFRIRNINKQYARSSPESQLKKKELAIKEREQARIKKFNNIVANGEKLYGKLRDSIAPEDYLLFTSLPPRKPDFDWISNSFYPGRAHVEIEEAYAQWAILGRIFVAKLESGKNSKRYIKSQINNIKFLFDYVFFYLPLWKEQHPNSHIRLPKNIVDFDRIAFWCDDLIDLETVSSYLDGNGVLRTTDLPLTALKLRTLMHTEKSTKPFVNAVHLFFEIAKTYGATIGIVGADYANPVNRNMDSTGSGGRSKSDKIQFPKDVSIVAKTYMSALDSIGVKIRESILNGNIKPLTIAELKSSEWIDLTRINLATNVTVRSQNRPLETYDIAITKIPNIYNWWHDTYRTPQEKNGTITTYLPWLSTLRMLAVGLFAGQRIQNGQWLDLRTFDANYKSTYVDSFNLCLLYVNTDKSGYSKDAAIDGDVMESLIDEKFFQTQICESAPRLVYYENDPRDPNEYGLICPLFRSPWGGNDLPFSDSKYAEEWLHFCRGLEQVYNSLVEPEFHHKFTRISAAGIERAVHVPHSLRVTWISHMRLYGHLDVSYAALQAGHSIKDHIAVETEYYTKATPEDMLENINRANNAVSENAYEALMGKIPHPSSPKSAICKGWKEDKRLLIKDQHFRSQHFSYIETGDSGVDLIATTTTPPGFYTHCICMLDGECPKRLIEFTGRARVCSLCEIAVWGIDHLPGINVKMRQAQANSIRLIDKIKKLDDLKTSQSEIEPYHQELTIARYEVASYKFISDQLSKLLESDTKNPKYISRYRDLSNVKRHAVDMSNPVHRVIAGILDSEAYPHLTSEHYPYMVERLAKSPELLKFNISDKTPKRLLACQIATILRTADFTIDEMVSLTFKPEETIGGHDNGY